MLSCSSKGRALTVLQISTVAPRGRTGRPSPLSWSSSASFEAFAAVPAQCFWYVLSVQSGKRGTYHFDPDEFSPLFASYAVTCDVTRAVSRVDDEKDITCEVVGEFSESDEAGWRLTAASDTHP